MRSRRLIPPTVRTAIVEQALEFVEGSYRRHTTIGGPEPCVSVGLVTDYLRQAYMPEDFRWATKEQQRSWVRSTLESLRRGGKLGSSLGDRQRCYEPARPVEKKTGAQLDAEIAEVLAKETA